jgi:2-C-methyl-D-erythritol 4-phosphate cytidylyltransferase
MKKSIVIVAGGKGLRMGGDIPKQFLPVKGVPVLMRTIQRFYDYDNAMQIVLVLPEAQQGYWKQLCEEYRFSLPYVLANGGETRFHSVRNGIAKVDEGVGLIGVHDGVRPFVSVETIAACFDEAARSGAVVPVIDVVETVRHLRAEGSVTVPRSEYRLVQTPQVFDAELLRRAYGQPYTDFFTDDASVVERYGHAVSLVQGNRENIKITTPYDMRIAEVLG